MKKYRVLEDYAQLKRGQVITAKDLNYDYDLLDLLLLSVIIEEDDFQ